MNPENIKQFSNFDFPDNTEWILSHLHNEYLNDKDKNKTKEIYDFDIWVEGSPTKSIAKFKTKTPKQMAEKIKKLVVKLNKKKK